MHTDRGRMNTKTQVKGEIECHWLFSSDHEIPEIKYTHTHTHTHIHTHTHTHTHTHRI